MSFSTQVARFSRNAMSQSNQVKRTVALRLFAAVIKDTPVLEGTLRGSWIITTDSPGTGFRGNQASMDSIIGASELHQDLFITSNLPYAYPIEFLGHSSVKAPQGMVRKNAIRFQSVLRAAVRRANGTVDN